MSQIAGYKVYFQGGSPHFPTRRVVINTDGDGTFWEFIKEFNGPIIPERLRRNESALNEHGDKAYFTLTTNRSLGEMKVIAPNLDKVRMYALGLKNGFEYYINPSPEQPASDWIASLTTDKADQEWRQEMLRRTGGLNQELIESAFEHVIKNGITRGDKTLKFKKDISFPPPLEHLQNYVATISDKGEDRFLTFQFFKDELGCSVMNGSIGDGFRLYPQGGTADKPFRLLTPEHIQWRDAIAQTIEAHIRQQAPTVHFEISPHVIEKKLHVINVKPLSKDPEKRHISKAALLEHIVASLDKLRKSKGLPNLAATITLGNEHNDKMLWPQHYNELPNYRVLVGDSESLDALRGQPNTYEEPVTGLIQNGIDHFMRKIDQSLSNHTMGQNTTRFHSAIDWFVVWFRRAVGLSDLL